jgi:hypothetical protein
MTDVAGALEKAADLIETVGWVQGKSVQYGRQYDPFDPFDGPVPGPWARPVQILGYCASGALSRGASTGQEYEGAMAVLAYEVSGWNRKLSVIQWNDTPGRTKYEVIDAMRHAAKNLRNEAVPS